MNAKKCLNLVNEFHDVAAEHEQKYRFQEPTVEDLQDMKKKYAKVGIALNKAIDEPEERKKHEEELLASAQKAGLTKEDLQSTEQHTTQFYRGIWTVARDATLAASIFISASLGYWAGTHTTKPPLEVVVETTPIPEPTQTIILTEPEKPTPPPKITPITPKKDPAKQKLESQLYTTIQQLEKEEKILEYQEVEEARFLRSIGHAVHDIGSAVTLGAIKSYDGETAKGLERIGYPLNRLMNGAFGIPRGFFFSVKDIFVPRDKKIRQYRKEVRQLQAKLYK
jgi:hypothetical protein